MGAAANGVLRSTITKSFVTSFVPKRLLPLGLLTFEQGDFQISFTWKKTLILNKVQVLTRPGFTTAVLAVSSFGPISVALSFFVSFVGFSFSPTFVVGNLDNPC